MAKNNGTNDAGGADEFEALPGDEAPDIELPRLESMGPHFPGLRLTADELQSQEAANIRRLADTWLKHWLFFVEPLVIRVSPEGIDLMLALTGALGAAARDRGIDPKPLFRLMNLISFAGQDFDLWDEAATIIMELAYLPDAPPRPAIETPQPSTTNQENTNGQELYDNPSRPVSITMVARLLGMDPRTLRKGSAIRFREISPRRCVFDLDQIEAIDPSAADAIKPG